MRLPSPMLPERSTTRVRLTDGRSAAATSRAVTATRTGCAPSASDRTPDSVRTERSASVGAGSPYASVDPLLRAHRLRRRAGALGDVRLRDPVGAVVDVEGERRQRVARGVDVAADPLVLERVARLVRLGGLGGRGIRALHVGGVPATGVVLTPARGRGEAHSPSRSGSRRTAVVSSCRLRRGLADGRSAILASRPDRDLTVIPT